MTTEEQKEIHKEAIKEAISEAVYLALKAKDFSDAQDV
jgi:hypothetical protein